MKVIDFICDLISPRKSTASIIRNKVLDEVIDSVHIVSVRANSLMITNAGLFTSDYVKGYNVATKEALLTIANLKKD